jgi:hypothetical protein
MENSNLKLSFFFKIYYTYKITIIFKFFLSLNYKEINLFKPQKKFIFFFLLNKVKIYFIFLLNKVKIYFFFLLNRVKIYFFFLLNKVKIYFFFS